MMTKPFYMKIAFQGKIKKYAVNDLDKVDFKQIHNQLGLVNKWKDYIFYYQIVDDFSSSKKQAQTQLTQEDIIAHLHQNQPQPGNTIKLRILQRQLMSEQENRRKQSLQSLQVPENIEKKRSKSVELDTDVFDLTCKTEVFELGEEVLMSPKNFDAQSDERNKVLHNLQKSNRNYCLQQQQTKNFLYKSTQVSSSQQIVNSKTFSKQNMLGSFTKSSQFQKIQNCLHQSIRITERQKTELQKLKNRIKLREKQLQRTECTLIDAKQILKMLDLTQ